MTTFLRQIFLLILLAFLPILACSASLWDEFLLNPNSEKLKSLEASILASPHHCEQDIGPTEKQTMALLKLIKSGNPLAYRIVLIASRCIGVADLEDLYRSAGVFFETQPRDFLKLIKEQAIPDRDFGYMLTMISLATTDDIDAQLSSIENRIVILRSIHDASITDVKIKALSILIREKNGLAKFKVDKD